jgi:hypothetical protein
MKIYDLSIPEELAFDISRGGLELNEERTKRIELAAIKIVAAEPRFYGFETVVAESKWIRGGIAKKFFLGAPNSDAWPGDIEPKKAVIIGEIAYESPIALDFRQTPPTVVYVGNRTLWYQLSRSYADLKRYLGLS